MAKIGRNDPCSCGSGKKYKRCCLAVHQAAQAAARTSLAREPAHLPSALVFDDVDELAQLSNAVLDLIEERRLDEAEKRCQELRHRFPEASDGIERLGHVHEVRGDLTTAAAHYRKAAAFIRERGESEDEHAAWLDQLADRVDPP
jgi:tetratricopeptide (TPR) repeat protein